jgi:hypothetical protein
MVEVKYCPKCGGDLYPEYFGYASYPIYWSCDNDDRHRFWEDLTECTVKSEDIRDGSINRIRNLPVVYQLWNVALKPIHWWQHRNADFTIVPFAADFFDKE